MTKPRISQALLWLLVAVTVVLFGFFIALVVGAVPIDDPLSPADSEVLRSEPAPTTSDRRSGGNDFDRGHHCRTRRQLVLGTHRFRGRARAGRAATRSGQVGAASCRAHLALDRRRGKCRRDRQRQGAQAPPGHGVRRSRRERRGSSDGTLARAPIEAEARSRRRCIRQRRSRPIRLLDRTREPHEGLGKTKTGHDCETNHRCSCSRRKQCSLLIPRSEDSYTIHRSERH